MSRKILKKIKLINWHYFENVELEVEDSALFFGDNGSGKSTVLDALQYVLTGGGKSFNKAANENSRRDLKGYVRCKTGGEGKIYKRNGKVTSFVALEFYEESKKQHFVVGVKLDSPSEEGQIRRGWFIENCRLEDIVFTKDNKPVSDAADFTARGKKIQCIKTDEDARARIWQRLGNLDYKIQELIPKSLAFKPMKDIKEFITRFLLPENKVDVQRLRQDIDSVREMEDLIVQTKEKIAKLTEICDAYSKICDSRKEAEKIDIMLALAEHESLKDKIKTGRTEISTKERTLSELQEKSGALEKEWEEIDQYRTQAYIAKEKSDTYQLIKNSTKEKEEREYRLNAAKANYEKFEECRKALQRLFYDLKLSINLAETLENSQTEEEKIFSLTQAEQLFTEIKGKNESDYYKFSSEKEDVQRKLGAINGEIANLKKNKLSYDDSVLKVRAAIEKTFREEEIDCPVTVLCEALEITDETWRDAIEGYLNTQKFALLVPPQYFKMAVRVYRGMSREVSGVFVVDTTKFLSDEEVPSDTLAYYVSSENIYARRYANYLLQRVYTAQSEDELISHKIAITSDCMLYQGYAVRRIPREAYRVPFIGKNAARVQLQQKEAEAEEIAYQLQNLKERLQKAEGLKVRFNNLDIRPLRENYRAAQEIKELNEQIAALEKEIKKASKDTSFLAFDEQIEKYNKKLKKIRTQIGEIQKEQGGYEEQIRSLKKGQEINIQRDSDYIEKIEVYRERQAQLLEEAQEKLVQEKNRIGIERVRDNFSPRLATLKNQQDKLIQQLVTLQSDFNRINESDYARGSDAEEMQKYEEQLDLLVRSRLAEYEGKLDRRKKECEEEFRSAFLSKMKENIEMARRTFDDLNKVLKGIDYNGVFYRFLYSANKNKKRLYDMIMDNSNLGGYTLFTDSFESSYREEMEDLFGKLRAQDANGAQVLDEYSDYRNYLDYDIEIKEGEKIVRFSSVGAESSGGETQVPYYVIIAASFSQIYKDDTVKLIMLDEAFDKMDDFRIDSMLHFFTKLGFQMILATPPQKVPIISESVKSVFMTVRQGEQSVILPYYNERV